MTDILGFDKDHIWHPYTSIKEPLPVYEAVSANGVRIRLSDGTELIDGMASWWCAIHGYGNQFIARAIETQVEKMAHVMFGGLTHEPAVELSQRLVEITPEGLDYVFFFRFGVGQCGSCDQNGSSVLAVYGPERKAAFAHN